jgi:diketogulonate reductase-like aldo/keto reductase
MTDHGPELDSLADTVEIAPGVLMPRLGLGTYKSDPGPDVEREVRYGLSIGYRLIDTAALYGNEASIGAMVRESGLARDEVFVTTKLWNTDQGYETALRAFDLSMARLGFDYVDLYLVHWPIPEHTRDTWRAMEAILASGAARAIGVCNFMPHHLTDLLAFANTPPAVDQVERHPLRQLPDLTAFGAGHGITLQAWAPIIRGRVNDIPLLAEVGTRHGKTPAQVAIRWELQTGWTTIPKSVHEERVRENADVFDFTLTEGEMDAIAELDRAERIGLDPDRFSR